VTAEGVETPSELETVATMGADHVQGYLLARPTTDRVRWSRWWNRNWIYPAALDLDAPDTSRRKLSRR
jgi:EAL domain-containing protein (putative c-di-GMP-specific phosphodiesterase class I)